MARLVPRLALVVVLLGAVAIRVDFTYNAYCFKGDHGTAALVSWHVLQGRELPFYSYGSFKVGTIGNCVGAAMFALFGVSPESLCFAMTLFTLLWVYASYLLFGRLVGRWAGVIAAALVAFAPYTVMWYSVVPMVFYPPTFAFGTLVLYLGVRLNDRDLTPGAEWGCLLGMAALAGLAIWTNPLSVVYLLVGAGLLVAHVVRSRLRRALIVKLAAAFLALLVASSPVLLTLWQHGSEAVYGYRLPKVSLIGFNLELVRDFYVADMLLKGVSERGLVRWLLTVAYAVPAVVFVVGFVFGLITAIARGDRWLLRAALVPVLFVLSAALLFLPSPMAATKASRYFVPFYLGVTAVFAFPLVFRRRWVTAATAGLALIVIGGDICADVGAGHGRHAGVGKRRMAEMQALVRRAEAAGLHHVMIDSLEGQTLTFVARERVVFARTFQERYYPYAVGAAADDCTGFAKAQQFASTLRCVGVSDFKTFTGAGEVVFYGLVLPAERLRLVDAEAVVAVAPSRAVRDACGLIDQNEETMVGDRFDAETALLVDLGQEVPLCGVRFVAPHEWDCPGGYRLSGSVSGSEWFDLQTVEARAAFACVYGNRFYYRGHGMPMECRFPARPVRYLKLDGLRPAAPRLEGWRLQEAYFYTAAGAGLPDEQEAAEIARALGERGVGLAVCDEWLSRKIELQPGPRPDVLPHYEWQCRASHVSRVLPVREGVAVTVENGHVDQCRALLRRETLDEVTVVPITFPHYTALVIEQAPSSWREFPGLKWNGFTLVRTASAATAAWYQAHGKRLERAGRRDEAIRCFERAFETFPGIRANLKTLAARNDEKAAAMLELLTPEHDTPCSFHRSIRLVGYTLIPKTLVPGERATLRLVWALEGEMPYDYLPVFVHFLDADAGRTGAIRFQADHNVTFPVMPGSPVPLCLVLDEHTFDVPAGCEARRMVIRLGALQWGDQRRRLKPRSHLPKRDRAVEVGVVEVAPSSGESAGAISM